MVLFRNPWAAQKLSNIESGIAWVLKAPAMNFL